MTTAHIFFIPFIFTLGGLFGAVLTRNKLLPEKNPDYNTQGRSVLTALAFFIVVFIATHVLSFPYSSVAVKEAIDGLALFDTSPAFSGVEVYERLEAYGVAGRAIYQTFLYTTDVFFPLTFLGFLFLFARFASERASIPTTMRKIIVALPLLWFFFDMVENSISYTLVSSFPQEMLLLAGLLWIATVAKFSLLFLSIVIPAGLAVKGAGAGVLKVTPSPSPTGTA